VLEQLEERTAAAKQHLREPSPSSTASARRCTRRGGRRLGEEALHPIRDRVARRRRRAAIAGGKDDLARFSVRKLLPMRRGPRARRRTAEPGGERALAEALAAGAPA
jgi:hypothetical protein